TNELDIGYDRRLVRPSEGYPSLLLIPIKTRQLFQRPLRPSIAVHTPHIRCGFSHEFLIFRTSHARPNRVVPDPKACATQRQDATVLFSPRTTGYAARIHVRPFAHLRN